MEHGNMKNRIFLLIISVVIIFGFSCSDNSQPGDPGSTPYKYEAAIDSFVDSLIAVDSINGTVVGVWENLNSGFYLKAKGVADAVNKTTMLTDNKFCIASITKTFVAALVLQNIEEGKLKLSDKISVYLPDSIVNRICVKNIQSFGNSITIEMLLNHSSGIPDFEDSLFLVDEAFLHPKRQWMPVELIRYVIERNLQAYNIPNEGYHYSNTNYILLGIILENINGKPLHQQLRENIYTKAGITDATMANYEPLTGILSHGYFFDGTDVTDYNISWEWACGGIITSAEGVYRFIYNLTHRNLFKSDTTYQRMINTAGYNFTTQCGLGIFNSVYNGTRIIGHSGGAIGYTSYMYYLPDKERFIVVLANEYSSIVGAKIIDFLIRL